MLRLARALGFTSPLVIALLALMAPIVIGGAGAQQRGAMLTLGGLALAAGITGTALVCWLYIGWRFNRMAQALESTLSANAQVTMRDAGIPGERRLARAFNASVGTFMQGEARATRNRTYLFRALDEEAPVRRAPISAERRAAATAIGRWANDTATEALASVLAPQPNHRGRPSDMIASLATGIALEMGMPVEEIERIRIAALLHDLGKLAVPSDILDKPTTLSDYEWEAIGEHPRIGQVILEQASSLRDAIPVVLHHHERFNGGGYPHGLKGAEIPLGARIVAVADAYHAMIHDRPYSSARAHHEALEELRQHAGSQFDPDVVAVFCQIYQEGVPPDGLEEVHRLHERASGGLTRIDPHARILHRGGHAHAARPARRQSARQDPPEASPAPTPIRRATG